MSDLRDSGTGRVITGTLDVGQEEAVEDDLPRGPGTTTVLTRWRTAGTVTLWVLIVVPILLSFAEAIRSPRLNFWDFWNVLGRTTTPDGVLDPSTFSTLYNEHPIITPALAFWLDAKLFAGANWALGVATAVLGLAMLLAMWRMLPARLTGAPRFAVLATLSLLVFSSAGTEYYGAGWMGIQWFLGIAPAVVALAFAHHGRTTPAVVLAVLASLGHGSAFPVWIALGLIAWLRRDRLWRILLPLVFGLVVLILWRLAADPNPNSPPAILGADTYFGSMMTVLSRTWAAQSADNGMIFGVLTLVAIGFAVFDAVKQRITSDVREPASAPVADDAGWIGLGVHMVLAAAMIGFGRGMISNAEGLSPRYSIIGLLATGVIVVLVSVRGPRVVRTRIVPIALAIGLVSYAVGSTSAIFTRTSYPTQPLLAVALRTGAKTVITKMNAYPDYLPKYRALGVYPFTDDFTLGCGAVAGAPPELGSHVDLASARQLPTFLEGSGRSAGVVETPGIIGNTELKGWAFIDGDQAECVLVTTAGGEVVGGGAIGVPRRDIGTAFTVTGRAGWEAVAAPEVKDGVVLVVRKGVLYRLPVLAAAPA